MNILRLVFLLGTALIAYGSPFGSSLAGSALGENKLLNGTFEEAAEEAGKQPKDWRTQGLVKRTQDKGNWKLKLTGKSSSPHARAAQTVSLPKDSLPFITVSTLVKGTDIQSVNEDQEGVAGLVVQFFDKDGKPVGKPLKSKEWDGKFSWRPWSGHARIPPEAATLEVGLELRGALGAVFFDEVKLAWGLPDDFDWTNFVIDGGFEYFNALSAWTMGEGHKIIYPGFEGLGALSLGSAADRSSTFQSIVIENTGLVQKAGFKMNYRFEGVEASQEGGGIKVEIEFLDAQGNRVDTVMFGPWTGKRDWTQLTGQLTLPSQTVRAVLGLTMEHAKGMAQFDNVRLEFQGQQGVLERRLESRTDTREWKIFQPVAGPLQGPLDLSSFLDPPAGKHGFLQAEEDGHFYFEDGTRARFLGINLQPPQALPTHEEAELFAERLAQLGFNLVRLHHLDAPWAAPNLFDPNFNDTQHFSKESLDRLDYFIAQLKSRGIYIYLDLLVSREFKSGDKVPGYLKLSRGAKGAALYNHRLIELQKKYAHDLLTHKNPYTKKKLIEEAAIVMMEIANENSLCRFHRKLPSLPLVYLEELRGLWLKHLALRGISHPERQAERYQDLKDPEVQAFYAGLQRDYFQEMSAFLKKLGLKAPLAGSNFALAGHDLETNAELDFIDRHAYWDPPEGGYGDFIRFHNRLITQEMKSNPIVNLARLKVKGKPFVVGEWNIDWPNEYRAAGPLLMAAYASLQDWDAILQFNFEGDLEPDLIKGNFDVSTKPEIFLQFAAAARLFHGRYVSPASEETINPSEFRPDDSQGIVLIESPKIVAAMGMVESRPIRFAAAAFKVESEFASLCLVSLDDLPLMDSKHWLLTAVARAENTGTIYNATRTFLRSSGTRPILLEPVKGSVSFPLKGRALPKVFVLDASGKRTKELKIPGNADLLEIPLGEGPVYEITF